MQFLQLGERGLKLPYTKSKAFSRGRLFTETRPETVKGQTKDWQDGSARKCAWLLPEFNPQILANRTERGKLINPFIP